MASSDDGFNPDGELSDIISELWDLDDNKCYPYDDYEIDIQGYVKSTRHLSDHSEGKFFTWLDEERIFERPTYKTFLALLNNYEMDVGAEETVDREEIQENRDFIDAIMETEVMKRTHQFLISKNAAPEDRMSFKRQLYDAWFRMFRRGTSVKGSSSFEHVFVGESRGDEFIGLHNWIQFYQQEKLGNIDYFGHFRRETVTDDEIIRLLSVQFTWRGQKAKPMCSVFIGSSPEFEIAAYTICMLLDKDGDDKVDVKMGEYEVELTVHAFGSGKYRKVGTAYIAGARMQKHAKQYNNRRKH